MGEVSKMINDQYMAQIWGDMIEEFTFSNIKHPKISPDLVRRAGVVLEEAGEAFKEAMNATRPGESELAVASYRTAMRHELIQTMSSAFKMILALDRDDREEPRRDKILS